MNWRTNADEVIKTYKRYLKDNGVFNQVLKIHRLHCKGSHKVEEILVKAFLPLDFIANSNTFTFWETLKEGRLFWWGISNKWKYKCLTEKIGGENIYPLSSYLSTIDMYESFLDEYQSVLEKEEINRYNKMILNLNEESKKLTHK